MDLSEVSDNSHLDIGPSNCEQDESNSTDKGSDDDVLGDEESEDDAYSPVSEEASADSSQEESSLKTRRPSESRPSNNVSPRASLRAQAKNKSLAETTKDLRSTLAGQKTFKPEDISKYQHHCSECTGIFLIFDHLKNHLRLTHGIESVETKLKKEKKEYPCSHCEKVYLRKYQLERHHLEHIDIEQAGESFNEQLADQSGSELDISTQSEVKSFSCGVCSKNFKVESSLAIHMKSHSRTTHECDICGRSYRLKRRFEEHLKTHSGKTNDSMESSVDLDETDEIGQSQDGNLSPKKSIKKKAKTPHVCSICGKELFNTTKLKEHMLDHTGERPYMCEFCGKSFKHKKDLAVHVKIHLGIKNYVCNICGRQFIQHTNLKTHMDVHNGVRVKCDLCDKSFPRGHLKIHMITHTKEKAHVCSSCGMRFTLLKNLKRHERRNCWALTHAGGPLFSCDTCPLQFKKESELKKHQVIHGAGSPLNMPDVQYGAASTLFSCNVCELQFKKQSELKKHLVVHATAAPLFSALQYGAADYYPAGLPVDFRTGSAAVHSRNASEYQLPNSANVYMHL